MKKQKDLIFGIKRFILKENILRWEKGMKKVYKNLQIPTLAVMVVFGVGLFLSIFELSKTVSEISDATIAATPEAVLASAGVEENAEINLPVTYFDQKADECVNLYDAKASQGTAGRQFEWTNCGYKYKELEQGLVEYSLSDNYLPVGKDGKLIPNKNLKDMDRWFSAVEGKSKEYAGTIKLKYKKNEIPEFSYVNGQFYPLDEVEFSKGDTINSDGHNHLFTMSLAIPFAVLASGEEEFEIAADDDTFVFVGNDLAIDMGGIHEATTGKLMINEKGEIYTAVGEEEFAYSGIQKTKGEGAIIRIFHADRDSESSAFKMILKGMSLHVTEAKIAGTDGVQIAYDPKNPSYMAPLGESSVYQPNGTKGYMIIATVEGVLVAVFAIALVILAGPAIKNRIERKNKIEK